MTNDEVHQHNLTMLASFESGDDIPRCAAILGASEFNGKIILHLAVSPHLANETLISTLRAIADHLEMEAETEAKGAHPS